MLVAPLFTDDDAANIARVDAEIQRLAQTSYQYARVQTEVWLADHLDLKDTHRMGTYPTLLTEWPDGTLAWADPKVLLPKDQTWPMSFEEAKEAGLPTTLVMRLDIALDPPLFYPRTLLPG